VGTEDADIESIVQELSIALKKVELSLLGMPLVPRRQAINRVMKMLDIVQAMQCICVLLIRRPRRAAGARGRALGRRRPRRMSNHEWTPGRNTCDCCWLAEYWDCWRRTW
jgi:hypothetical protein